MTSKWSPITPQNILKKMRTTGGGRRAVVARIFPPHGRCGGVCRGVAGVGCCDGSFGCGLGWIGGCFELSVPQRKSTGSLSGGFAGDASIPWESVGGYNVGGLGQKATGPPSKLPLVVRDSLGSGAVSCPFEEGSCGESHSRLQGGPMLESPGKPQGEYRGKARGDPRARGDP